jgi:hypothetical protein
LSPHHGENVQGWGCPPKSLHLSVGEFFSLSTMSRTER